MITKDAEIPWMGCVSTGYDVFRFVEMLRRGGELDGVRILSPTTVNFATKVHTGSLINQHDALISRERGFDPGPANYGLGFTLRGETIHLEKMGHFYITRYIWQVRCGINGVLGRSGTRPYICIPISWGIGRLREYSTITTVIRYGNCRSYLKKETGDVIRFELPTAILFGSGSIGKVGEEAAKLGHKAMVVTYPDIRRIGLVDKVLKDLKANKIDALVFEKVEPNPRSLTVDEGASIARKEKIDMVIGLGGGSAMDAAKGIAVASSGTASIWDHLLKRADIKGTVPPIIQIPTMAGTGSETNNIAVITNWETHVKSGLGDSHIQG